MISYEEALRLVIEFVAPLPPVELPLSEAAGLILASPATARWDLPRCDNSAMDGFALAGVPEDPREGLSIIGSSYAGHPFLGEVKSGQAVRITTGAALPEGADTVVPIEDVAQREGRLYLADTPYVGQHVRYRGEECQKGEILVEAAKRLGAGEIALLASAGVDRVRAFPRPRVAVISTGDELVELGQEPGPEQIVNSNIHLLMTRLSECGCTPLCVGTGTDDPAGLDEQIERSLDADVILSTGGVSVGEKDHVQTALERRKFRKIFWKVAIKPGKPVLFGMLQGKPCFGLPGNPASTAATFELFVKPALKKLAGHSDVLPEKRKALLTHDVLGSGKRQVHFWSVLKWRESGYEVTVSPWQGSGKNRCLTDANAILPMPLGAERLNAGERVEVLLL